MTQWIETKVRYDKTMENGMQKKAKPVNIKLCYGKFIVIN